VLFLFLFLFFVLLLLLLLLLMMMITTTKDFLGAGIYFIIWNFIGFTLLFLITDAT